MLFVGCKKDEVPPAPPVAAPAPAPTLTAAPAEKMPVLPPTTPALTPAPASAPVILTTPPPPASASVVAPTAPAAPAAPKDTSLAATTAQALKQTALDTLQRIATDARTNLLPAGASPLAPGTTSPTAATPNTSATVTSLADLSTDQVTRGLKEALAKGLQQAVGSLGHSGGFMTNLNVKIPMPEKLQTLEKTLRALHQDKYADDFIATMNQAAEQAVPAAAEVFTGSLSKMTVDDARKILKGPDNAATQFFRQTNEKELKDRFLPIVQKATASTGVTAAYKQILDRAKIASPFLSSTAVDVDGYVTDKAMDGLFTMVAAEEKRIRENPLARTTDLLKSVFGSLGH